MSQPKPRVRVPRKASVGEIITIKSIITHRMESGHRRDRDTGELLPRKIINKFSVTFNGELVFTVDLFPSIASNPFIEFKAKVPETGVFAFEWFDDDGSVYTAEKKIEVS